MALLRYLLAFGSISVILLLLFAQQGEAQARGSDAVHSDQVTGVLLRKGSYAAGRRTRPIPQLQCIGGAASGKWEPEEVACTKSFTDGRDVYWKCEADMPDLYKFGTTDVNCEGYNYPDDPYILAGSCALRYTLEYTAKGLAQQQHQHQQQQQQHNYHANPNVYTSYQKPVTLPGKYGPSSGADTSSGFWVALVFGSLILYSVLSWMGHIVFSPVTWVRNRLFHGFAHASPPPTYDTSYTPIYPNTYNTHAYHANAAASSAPSSGFWTGLLGGGALGYLYNRFRSSNQQAQPPTYTVPVPPTHTNVYHSAPPSYPSYPAASSSPSRRSPSPPRERHATSWATESRR